MDLCKLYSLTDKESFVPILKTDALRELAQHVRTRQTSHTSPEALFNGYKKYVLPSLVKFIGSELANLGDSARVATPVGLFIWAVLFGEHFLASKIWENCIQPLRLALLAKWISQQMKRADPFKREEANEMMAFYEGLASRLLECSPSVRYSFGVLQVCNLGL